MILLVPSGQETNHFLRGLLVRGLSLILKRVATGFLRWAKIFELNFFIRKRWSNYWAKSPSKPVNLPVPGVQNTGVQF